MGYRASVSLCRCRRRRARSKAVVDLLRHETEHRSAKRSSEVRLAVAGLRRLSEEMDPELQRRSRRLIDARSDNSLEAAGCVDFPRLSRRGRCRTSPPGLAGSRVRQAVRYIAETKSWRRSKQRSSRRNRIGRSASATIAVRLPRRRGHLHRVSEHDHTRRGRLGRGDRAFRGGTSRRHIEATQALRASAEADTGTRLQAVGNEECPSCRRVSRTPCVDHR